MRKSNEGVSLNRVINVILTIILFGIIVFGWWYLKNINPLDYISGFYEEKVQPKYLFSIYGSPEQLFNRPSYTYVSDERIYVADTNNGRIAVFDYNGNFVKEIGNTGEDKLTSPVAMTKVEDKLYISDAKASKIFIFNLSGQFQGYFNIEQNIIPGSIFYKNRKLYIIDSKSMSLKIYDVSGRLLQTFGGRGSETGKFFYPYTVYVDEAESIYVADSNNGRIQVFDQAGNIEKIIDGVSIKGEPSFSVPRGIAIDESGHLFTTEGLNNSVAIINSEGYKIGTISEGEPMNAETGISDPLSLPTEVFIDKNQRLYVTEFGNSRVLVYSLK